MFFTFSFSKMISAAALPPLWMASGAAPPPPPPFLWLLRLLEVFPTHFVLKKEKQQNSVPHSEHFITLPCSPPVLFTSEVVLSRNLSLSRGFFVVWFFLTKFNVKNPKISLVSLLFTSLTRNMVVSIIVL